MYKYYFYKTLRFFHLISKKKFKKKIPSGYKIIAKSKYFDAKWYLKQNPDVKAAKIDPVIHYLQYGWKEGRNPSASFDGNLYLDANVDVFNSNICPLLHYVLYGYNEKRSLNNQIENKLIESLKIDENGLIILTTPHCLFIAKNIQQVCAKIHIKAKIITEIPSNGYENILHIVISPNMYDTLPKKYIAFQLEQLSSSKWYNSDYKRKLKNSLFIWDYCLENVEFLLNEGFDYNQIYYMPISPVYKDIDTKSKTYDVLFYGCVNSRREQILNNLKKSFNIKVIDNLFGKELYQELNKAKIILNLHYYENALLETTRLCEALTETDALIISEKSLNNNEYADICDLMDFVKEGDVKKLRSLIKSYLTNDKHYLTVLNKRRDLLKTKIKNKFNYYFYRFLLATDNISFNKFYKEASQEICFNSNLWCLGLPESINRHKSFEKDNLYGFEYFPGLRHHIGWVGCGLSYKFMLQKAYDLRLPYVGICEDDVGFDTNFKKNLTCIIEFLIKNNEKWDVFSGLMSDVSKNTKILNVINTSDIDYIFCDRMISMVFNIYNNTTFRSIANWNNMNWNTSNTIDRYLENSVKLKVATILPYLVSQKSYLQSSIWNFQNTQYDEMIKNSQILLNEKVNQFYIKEVYKMLKDSKA